ncbi:ABC transporter permease subunit [Aureliella helgolandensis]|uniref:ABC-2 family transporter protein n=1 Tax=Aureliella helgolandensis TaxID=2527968 RepID=A0A518G5M6_9BACT|nr:ABC transporter permease subunit [Aureliella helgolandensis]QDV23885.1 ABC-2 family transporter protein [Aureliella helgolandensis]
MTRLLIKKYIHESYPLFLACAILLTVFCMGRVWIVCQFDLQQFEPFLQQLKPFEKFMPVPLEQLLTHSGAIAMTLNEPLLTLSILLWCVARGSDVVSGELSRGTMEMLLAHPISRCRLLLTHAAMTTLGLAGLCGVIWLALYSAIQINTVRETVAAEMQLNIPFLPLQIPITLGSPEEVAVPLSEKVDAALYAMPCLNLFGLGFVILCLSILCSSIDRYRWRTIGVVLGIYISQFLLLLLSKATSATELAGRFTFLSLYQPDAIVQLARQDASRAWWLLSPNSRTLEAGALQASWPFEMLGPAALPLLLLGLGGAMLLAAVQCFERRDLAPPL